MKAAFSFFPKMFQSESLESLADILQETGIDGVDLLIRDGYWVVPANMRRNAAAYVRYMRSRGIEVRFATTSYTPKMLEEDAEPLKVMADLGIGSFRIAYFPYDASVDYNSQLEEWRRQVARLGELCSKHRLKALYQVHHSRGQFIHHSMSALSLVRDVPPEHVGIMLDPGNQFHEGRESCAKARAVLGHYLAAIGVKDVRVSRDESKRHLPGKGWTTEWAPCQDGLIDWHEISGSLRGLDNPLLVNLQMHYDDPDRRRLLATLREEWSYINRLFGERADAPE